MKIPLVIPPHRRPPLTGRLFVLAGLAGLATTAAAGPVFNNGFELGTNDWLLSTSDWKPQPANAQVSTVAREGTKSVHFKYTDIERSEFVIRNGTIKYNWGTEYWVGFSLRVAVAPTHQDVAGQRSFGIFNQHHATPHRKDWCVYSKCGRNREPGNNDPHWSVPNVSAGENSFTIQGRNGVFEVKTSTNPANVNVPPGGGATWGSVTESRNYVTNRWYDFVMHFKLAPDNSGFMKVWMKNTSGSTYDQLVNVVGGVTVYNYDGVGLQKSPVNYQKIGLYYGDGNQARAGEVLYDAFRIWSGTGGSFADVAPHGIKKYEGETLPIGMTSGDTYQTVAHSGASNGNYHLFNANAAGDYITYTVNLPSPGKYEVRTRITKAKNRGKYQLKIDGTNLGTAKDYYDPADSSSPVYAEINLGAVTLAAGNRSFRFESAEKNPGSASYKLGLDYIQLRMVP